MQTDRQTERQTNTARSKGEAAAEAKEKTKLQERRRESSKQQHTGSTDRQAVAMKVHIHYKAGWVIHIPNHV